MTKPIPNENDERLCDWVDGTMAPRDLERFEAELRVSKTLRERAEAYRRAVLAVRDGLATDDEPIDVAASVMARIRGDGASGPKAPEPVVSPRLPTVPGAWGRSALVAAAMLALIFLLDRLEPRVKTTESARAPVAAPAADAADPVRRLSDDSMLRFGRGAEAPVRQEKQEAAAPSAAVATASTTVPQIRLLRTVREPSGATGGQPPAPSDAQPESSDKSKEVAPGAQEPGDRYGGVDVLFGDLAVTVRAIGPVQLSALAPIVTAAGLPGSAGGGAVPRATRGWVVTGSAADVRAFLANVSKASRVFGYEVQNGEVEASSVVTRAQVPPRPSGPSSPGPQGPGGGKAAEPEVRVVLVIDA